MNLHACWIVGLSCVVWACGDDTSSTSSTGGTPTGTTAGSGGAGSGGGVGSGGGAAGGGGGGGVPYAGGCVAPPVGVGDPPLPQVSVDTTFVAPTGQSIAVPAGGDLQAAIAQAQPGDEIVLTAGATYSGNFTLPAKGADAWITIRSSALDQLPAGVRVTPSDAAKLAVIETPNTNNAVRTLAGAHHYRLSGLLIRPAPGMDVGDMVVLGDGGASDLASLGHHLIVDRCYVHADPVVGGKRGVYLNAPHGAVIDSHLSGFKRVGQDTQAILGFNGPGPNKIVNNYLEGAGENVMFGGADPNIANQIPEDVEICHNHFKKPLLWKADDPSFEGTAWTVKNLFELKMGRRVLFSGNVLEQTWAAAQSFAVNIKSANQDGGAPWSVTEDVTISYNVIRDVSSAITISAGDSGTTLHTNRVRVTHNVVHRVGGSWGSAGRLFQVVGNATGGVSGITFDHNTGFGVDGALLFDVSTHPSFVFTNNLVARGQYGLKGSGQAEGTASLAAFAPGYTCARNAVIGAVASSYPTDNFFPANPADVGFVDYVGEDFALATGSSLASMSLDGSDVGADISAVAAATAGAAP